MPEPGEIKHFGNGAVGRWDGQGWEQMGTAGASPQAQAPPQGDDSHLLRTFLTKVAAPAVGTIVGGAIGGPPGMGLGAIAGKGFGDATAAALGDTDEIQRDPSQELVDLGLTGAGAATAGAVLPQLQKLPGPFKLSNLFAGAVGGGLAGREFGHPGIGSAIGAGMGGYNLLSGLLRGAGAATEAIATPRFGSLAAAPEEAAAANPAVARAVASFKAAGVDPNSTEAQAYLSKIAAPQGSVIAPQPRPSTTPLSTPSQATPQPPQPRGRVSREVPGSSYPSNAPGGGVVKLHPSQLGNYDVMEQHARYLPNDENDLFNKLRGRELPTTVNKPNMSFGADVSTTGDWKPNNLEQIHPQEASWQDLASRSNPKRTSPQGQTFSVSRTPEEAISGLKAAGPPTGRTNPEPPSTVDDSGFKHGNRTPQTVDDLEGLSAAQQAAWEQFKRTNPGTSDSLLNSWLSSQPSQDPHAGLSLEEMGAKLADLVKRRR